MLFLRTIQDQGPSENLGSGHGLVFLGERQPRRWSAHGAGYHDTPDLSGSTRYTVVKDNFFRVIFICGR